MKLDKILKVDNLTNLMHFVCFGSCIFS